jgi:hypothetical protein
MYYYENDQSEVDGMDRICGKKLLACKPEGKAYP